MANTAQKAEQVLTVNKKFERELPRLTDEERALLELSIKRDGILDPIKYWINPKGVSEIIDGHNRHRIAQELGLMYQVQEIKFPTQSITAVLYWMHRMQGARRNGGCNTKRMIELKTLLKAESGEKASKTQIIKEVAKDAKVSERNLWRGVKATDKPISVKAERTPIDKLKDAMLQLTRDDLKQLLEWITKTLVDGDDGREGGKEAVRSVG